MLYRFGAPLKMFGTFAAVLGGAAFLQSCDKSHFNRHGHSFVGQTTPMDDFKGNERPTTAIIWKIGSEGDKNNLRIVYTDVGRFPVPAGADFDHYLQLIAENKPIPQLSMKNGKPRNEHRPENLRRKTDLSIHTNEFSYMVFILDPQVNWRFMDDEEPLEISTGDNEDYYTHARCAYFDAQNVFKVEKKAKLGYNCRIASFISDAKSQETKLKEFVSPFNMFITLTGKDASGTETILPVIIDPDVGYPGGNAP